MFIQATEILNKPVISSDAGESLGVISDIILNPENGQVIAFAVSRLFSKLKIVSEIDVLDLTRDGLIINSENALVDPRDVIKVKEILDKKIKIINSQAITESKKILGKVEDFLIDTETASVIKFYIRGALLSPSIILPSENLIKIEKNKIIFKDEVLEKLKATQAVAA